jgi:hypothetical protein
MIDWDGILLYKAIDPSGSSTYSVTETRTLLSKPYTLHTRTAESVINIDVDDAVTTQLMKLNSRYLERSIIKMRRRVLVWAEPNLVHNHFIKDADEW